MGLEIRHLVPDEASVAVEWARREGWNPGQFDLNAFLAQDPQGFLGGFVDGELIATISAVRYHGSYGFIGFYIVRPDFRGRGFGIQLWNAGMEQLENCNAGLDGVMAQVANYEKSGFQFAHQNRRYAGVPRIEAATPAGGEMVNARSLSLGELAAFDARYFPRERIKFLIMWLTLPGRFSRAFVQDGRIAGYGVARRAETGWRVGPLFAETPDIAAAILRALCEALPPGATIALDVPANHAAAVAMAEAAGLVTVFETARMYTGETPSGDESGVFGITSLELG